MNLSPHNHVVKLKLTKKIQSIAIEALNNEADAVKNLTNYIDDSFDACIEALFNCNGRIIVCGIGKSANIANKIVATLNSTGSPAVFLHAADAIHGDLGMVQNEDMVICLSKSGNTPEIKALLPLLKNRGASLVSIVGKMDSYLAKNSDFALNASVDKEACPNNLAPTSSTTAALAMGDAIAICLMELRAFSSKDFAERHPGGALGKQLYLTVNDLCDISEFPKVKENAAIDEVIFEISAKRLGATCVIDNNNLLLGLITDGDLRRLLATKPDLNTIVAKDFMTKSPKTIESGTLAVKALDVMKAHSITQLIVVADNQPVGIVHLHDLLKEGIDK